MERLLVSVIITCYNAKKFIKNTIDSVLSQNGFGKQFDLEILIFDDCSEDGTVDYLMNEYQDKIHVFLNERNTGGPNHGRNKGLDISKGDYICFLDHDDVWFEDRILMVLPLMKQGYPIISSGYIEYDKRLGKERYIGSKCKVSFRYFEKNETFLKKLKREKKDTQVTYLGVIVISKELKNIRFEEKYGLTDNDWVLRILENNTSAEVCSPVFKRVVLDKNLSLNPRYREKDYLNTIEVLKRFAEKYPEETKIGGKRLNGSYGRFLYLNNQLNEARFMFIASDLSPAIWFYLITSFVGRKWVLKYFKVFG